MYPSELPFPDIEPPADNDPLRDKIEVSLSGYVAHVLSAKNLQEPIRNVQPDHVDVMCIEAEQSSLIVHVFEGTRLEVLLLHHHKPGHDDIMRFTCENFLKNKELSCVEMGGVSVPGTPEEIGSIGKAFALGVLELENSKHRLQQAVAELATLTLTAENARYTTNMPKSEVQRLSSYTDQNLPF